MGNENHNKTLTDLLSALKKSGARPLVNGWGVKIISTTAGILLAAAVGGGVVMYQQVGTLIAKTDTIIERLDRVESRVYDLERNLWRNRRGYP